MFEALKLINARPKPYEFYTTETLWNDKHISKKMLEYHLDEGIDLASRNKLFIEKSVEWICRKFNVSTGTRILDLGCGPGLYTSRFSEKGANVTGIDFSSRSIQYAKDVADKNQLSINYMLGNYLDYISNNKFNLITLIYCDYCTLSPQQRITLLKNISHYLADGGSVLLDVCSLNSFRKMQEKCIYEYKLMNGFWSSEEYYGFYNVFKYDKEKIVLDKYTIIEKNRIWKIFNWLQYYDIEMLKNEFSENGFYIKEYFSDVSGKEYNEDSSDIAVILEKTV